MVTAEVVHTMAIENEKQHTSTEEYASTSLRSSADVGRWARRRASRLVSRWSGMKKRSQECRRAAVGAAPAVPEAMLVVRQCLITSDSWQRAKGEMQGAVVVPCLVLSMPVGCDQDCYGLGRGWSNFWGKLRAAALSKDLPQKS